MLEKTSCPTRAVAPREIATLERVYLPDLVGFPLLITAVDPGFYHVFVLPGEWPGWLLEDFVVQQAEANGFPAWLALAQSLGIDLNRPAAPRAVRLRPGGFREIVIDRLEPALPITETDELERRRLEVRTWVGARRTPRFLWGDLLKGGHEASLDEIAELAGRRDDGVPWGLERCAVCDAWKGRCLDPDSCLTTWVVTVSCACENDTRCARCGEPLRERRLRANVYDPADDTVWYWPGFGAFSHGCGS